MPLLKRKVFEKAKVPEFLRDDEEVFHCEVTNEIFRHYEEFCERMILVNSMIWTCSISGKSNLTYAEALESEENARKVLRDFPTQLRVPILYLASKTKRTTFTDMADDVWTYAKDRYFVGELIEACLTDGNWHEAQILQVMAPTSEAVAQYKKESKQSGEQKHDHFEPAACLYRYEVEKTADDNQIFIVEATKIRRKKSQYTLVKSRLFLKQFVLLSPDGLWRVKEPLYQKYAINRVTFDQIFDGPLPDFNQTRKVVKKQETLMKYVTKTNNSSSQNQHIQKDKTEGKNKKNLIEELKRRSEELKQKAQEEKQRKLLEKAQQKQKKRQEISQNVALMKEWNKVQDDLLLEDHKKLPEPTPVETRIPSTFFGDSLMVLDFVNTYSYILNTKKYFPTGFNLGLLERCLLEQEVNGPLTDLLKLLLNALFNMQKDEANEIHSIKNPEVQKTENNDNGNVTIAQAIRQASSAAAWCPRKQGLNLSQMPLDGLVITEVLRLHLLSSGAKMTENAARWQFQQRGGYMCQDDPGLQFRIDYPYIIRSLTTQHVTELPIGDKIKILTCLTNQISTYADVRDLIEERLEKVRLAKADLKNLQQSERKYENEVKSLRTKIKSNNKKRKENTPNMRSEIDLELQIAQQKIQKEYDKKQTEFNSKTKQLCNQLSVADTRIAYLGSDRAYRRYIFIQSIPALFVEHDEENPGPCLEKVIIPVPSLINADTEDTLQHIRQLFAEKNRHNDKENNAQINSVSPKKNGINNRISKSSIDTQLLKDLYMCTGNPSECLVHSNSVDKIKWSFYHKKEDIENLIDSLNKRGVRESELRSVLEYSKEYIESELESCPVGKLSLKLKDQDDKPRRSWKSRYANSNLGFDNDTNITEILELTLRDYILDLEQQIHSGGLGTLHVNDRTLWRMCLKERNYDVTHLKSNVTSLLINKLKVEEPESRSSTPSENELVNDENGLSEIKMEIDEIEENDKILKLLEECDDSMKSIIGLAIALQAVAYSVNEKYLNRPLGNANETRRKKNHPKRFNYLDRWNGSLMRATSYSQLFLHYSTLETCVALDKSALNARCFTCRKCTDDDQLLLCDGCNRGQHLYCVEPKLTSVPIGDWFCDRCKPTETPRTQRKSRKRRIFSETSDDEQNITEEIQENGFTNMKDESESEQSFNDLCDICNEGGRVMSCESCSSTCHPHCLNPPLKRIPRGAWICFDCKKKEKEDNAKKIRAERLEKRNNTEKELTNHQKLTQNDKALMDIGQSESSASAASSDVDLSSVSGARRCARQARNKIHGFIRTLRRPSLDSDSENDNSDDNEDMHYAKNANRRARRVNEQLNSDLPLHNASLHELLTDVLKHPDAWPFTQPVQKRDVPDYFDIIQQPMDFGTIKYKLNMGKYQYDAELMADAILVFENCNTYNDSEASVYKCGLKLLKFFKQRAQELGFRVPKMDCGMDEEAEELIDIEEPTKIKTKVPRKKMRTT